MHVNGLKHKLILICLLVFMAFTCISCAEDEEVIILRVCNWEEYIDLGDWDEDEVIELDDGTVIFGENSLVDDFEEWFYETYGKKVKVEYSTFGTNEELYNQLALGDEFDLVCPSEYMIMKMMDEDMLMPFSPWFHDENITGNYYARNVSPYIKEQFKTISINGNPIDEYAAGYMWGTLGIVYNPEYVSEEDAKHWDILLNKDYYKRITIKDSVRDAYFAAVAISKYDELMSDEFKNQENYVANLTKTINATDVQTVNDVEDILSACQKNVYSFETDAGKADMVTGKVVANEQWSGDAVYTMFQAMEDDVLLYYSAPEEATNLWFDGWCMLKAGVENDSDKQMAAEAFINYMSMPENAVRNMYYIGYTSVISGDESGIIEEYINYNYAAEDDAEEIEDYDVSYFFGRDVIIEAEPYMIKSQLGAQYPTEDIAARSVIMEFFDKDSNERINRMWTNVRCFDLKDLFNE